MTFEDFEEKHTLVRLAIDDKVYRQVGYNLKRRICKHIWDQAWVQVHNETYGHVTYKYRGVIYDF